MSNWKDSPLRWALQRHHHPSSGRQVPDLLENLANPVNIGKPNELRSGLRDTPWVYETMFFLFMFPMKNILAIRVPHSMCLLCCFSFPSGYPTPKMHGGDLNRLWQLGNFGYNCLVERLVLATAGRGFANTGWQTCGWYCDKCDKS